LGFTKPFLLHLLSLLDFNLPKNSISFLGIIREGYQVHLESFFR
jgi:hypothetical protein